MGDEVTPAILDKLGERGGLFDVILQRLIAEWHRFETEQDSESLGALSEMLEAGLAQVQALELLARHERFVGMRGPYVAVDAPPGVATPTTAEPAGNAVYAPRPSSSFRAADRSDQEPSFAGFGRGADEPTDALQPSDAAREAAARLADSLRESQRAVDSLREALTRSNNRSPGTPPSSPPEEATETEAPSPPQPAVQLHAMRDPAEEERRLPESPTPTAAPRDHVEKAQDVRAHAPREDSPVAASRGETSKAETAATPSESARAYDGLLAHEAFDVAASAELKRCRRFERDFSLLLLDVAAHADLHTGPTLLGNLREFDLLGRYDDNVFAVGLPETAAIDARQVAERLVGVLETKGDWTDQSRFGIASYPRDGNTLTTVVRTARSQLAHAGWQG